METDRLILYARIKWLILAVLALYVIVSAFIEVLPAFSLLEYFVPILLLAALNNILLQSMARRALLTGCCFSLFFDLLLVIAASYVGGGIENTWLFLPVISILSAGYIFGLRLSLLFAAASFIAITAMYVLEWYAIIPHFPGYGFPEHVWRNVSYGIDYIVGMFLLYFLCAFMSGAFQRNLGQALVRLQENLAEVKSSRRVQLSVMEDLETARGELVTKIKDVEDSRRATLHLLQDVEEERNKAQESEKEIARLYEDLKVIDRMKTELLSVVSHELKTPLTPILGYISLLKSAKLNTRQQKSVGIIERQAKHLLRLIESLLDVARLERGAGLELTKEPLSLPALLKDLVEIMKFESESRQLEIVVDLPKDFPTLMADQAKILRLMTNLLGNAIKFTPQSGRIRISGSRSADTVQLQVADNGIGISKEDLPNVFDKFYQVDGTYTRATGGIGLGLTMAKEIAEAHGGRMWAGSAGVGKGTAICFTLPIS